MDEAELDRYFTYWVQRNAPEVWYGKEHDQAKEREWHRLRMTFKAGWSSHEMHAHTELPHQGTSDV